VIVDTIPVFDKKYKVILECPIKVEYIAQMLDWINSSSQHSVDVKYSDYPNSEAWYAPAGIIRANRKMYIAFEDETDALIFKIKYL